MRDVILDISKAFAAGELVGQGGAVDTTPAAGLNLEQYMGAWAIDATHGMQLLAHFQGLDLGAHIAGNRDFKPDQVAHSVLQFAPQGADARGVGGAGVGQPVNIGVIEVRGALTKHGSSGSGGSNSLVGIGRMLDRMSADPSIHAIIMRVDSPGGTVAGTQYAAGRVQLARKRKPVVTYVDDLMASAATWLGSQADAVYVNVPTATIGSIGTYIGVFDYSAAFKEAGVEAVVVRARDGREDNMKGMGFPGTKITEEQKQKLQSSVDGIQDHFTAAVAQGRGMKTQKIEDLANGQVWHADDPAAAALHDGVMSFEDAVAKTAAMVGVARTKRRGAAGAEVAEVEEDATPLVVDDPPTQTTDEAGTAEVLDGDSIETQEKKGPAMSDAKDKIEDEDKKDAKRKAEDEDKKEAKRKAEDEDKKEKSATLAEIKEACPDASASFTLGQLEAGATLGEATRAYTDLLVAKNEALSEENAQLEVKSKRAVNLPLDGKLSIDGGGDAIDEFTAKVDALENKGMDRTKAHTKVCQQNPELRKQMVAQYNVQKGRGKQAREFLEQSA